MLPELGLILLFISLFFNIIVIFYLFYTYFYNINYNILNKIIYLSFGQLFFLTLSIITLLLSFLLDDFSVLYVYSNSNSKLPFIYKLSALWGAHEGSFLLLVFLFSFFIVFFSIFKFTICIRLNVLTRIILNLLLFLFMIILVITSNPFERIIGNYPIDGVDLNPLLQDIGLIIHPPLLYIGYIGFAFPFSFALSILLLGRLKLYYFKYLYIFSLFSLIFLTSGILLGSWWAYYELGWGGFWFWDPVENASFMPLLSGIILVHILVLLKHHKSFYKLSLFFSIITFLFCLLSIFIVRSGIINSVHSFAASGNRMYYFFSLFFVIFLFSLFVFFSRLNFFNTSIQYKLFSKDIILFVSVIFIIVALLTVLFGTFYPLLIDIIFNINISVGSSYFNGTVVPILLFSLSLIPFALFINWSNLIISYFNIIKVFLISSCLFFFIIYYYGFLFSMSLYICLFIIIFALTSMVFYLFLEILTFNRIIIFLSHSGIVLVLIGVSISSFFSLEKDIILEIGDETKIGDYNVALNRVFKKNGENYISYVGEFFIKKDNKIVNTLYPEKRMFYVSGLSMTEASIKSYFLTDFYIALGNKMENNSWGCRIYYKPFIILIWTGGLFCIISFLFLFISLFFKYIKY